MLTDTHAHLADSCYDPLSAEFCGVSSADIINNMAQDGLSKIISIGYDVASSAGSKKIAQNNKNIYFAGGIHPSESLKTTSEHCEQIYELCKAENKTSKRSDKCVAIGEIGLDYHYPDTDKPSQKKILLQQLEIANKLDLPVIFHVRDAYGDMMQIIKQNLNLLPRRGVMHCYSGSLQDALEYIKMGFYISFSGSITFKNAVNLQDIPLKLPRDKILVETDCPYLAPVPNRGKTNFPKYVSLTACRIAQILGVTQEEVASITSQNAKNLFGF